MASGGSGMSENVMGENLIGEYVVVFCTAAPNEADRIAGTLVEERLAACVNIASVRSCYRWEGKVARDTEELMIIKTKAANGRADHEASASDTQLQRAGDHRSSHPGGIWALPGLDLRVNCRELIIKNRA